MNARNMILGFVALVQACSYGPRPDSTGKTSATNATAGQGALRLQSLLVTRKPTLDGRADDAVWASAVPLQVECGRFYPLREGEVITVTIKSVHTADEIFFLATWKDSTKSDTHKSWVWNDDTKSYEQGSDREDMFSIAFEQQGRFDVDMLAGIPSVWDVWHWKARRTNPQGYATDKTHVYSSSKPSGKARSYKARTGKTLWIARPEDAGTSVEKKRAAPATFQGASVAQYIQGQPSGSAADVHARGEWVQGTWTLELSRRLNTGYPDDTIFDQNRSYQIAIASFDHTGSMDRSSSTIELSFR